MEIIYIIVLISLFEACGQYYLKRSEKQKNDKFVIVGLLSYMIVCFLLRLCYKNRGYIGQVNMMWSCMSIVVILLTGYVFFDEKISNNGKIALTFALLAIYFLNK